MEELWESLRDSARRASDCTSSLESMAAQEDVIASLRWINRTMVQLQEAAATTVELSIRIGNSQKKTADALGVPASTLAGARREFLG